MRCSGREKPRGDYTIVFRLAVWAGGLIEGTEVRRGRSIVCLDAYCRCVELCTCVGGGPEQVECDTVYGSKGLEVMTFTSNLHPHATTYLPLAISLNHIRITYICFILHKSLHPHQVGPPSTLYIYTPQAGGSRPSMPPPRIHASTCLPSPPSTSGLERYPNLGCCRYT